MFDFGDFAANWGGAHGVQKGIRREGRRKGGEGGRLATTEIGSLAQQLAGYSARLLKLGEGRRGGGLRGGEEGGVGDDDNDNDKRNWVFGPTTDRIFNALLKTRGGG